MPILAKFWRQAARVCTLLFQYLPLEKGYLVQITEEYVAFHSFRLLEVAIRITYVMRFHSETPDGPLRRGGRAVECACLENKYGGNVIAGSNPVPSAIFLR